MSASNLVPERIPDEVTLDEILTRPSTAVIDLMRRLDGDLMILGVGGKMGPTLARMAVRAAEAAGVSKQVYGVARFSDEAVRRQLESVGVRTLRCDLLDRKSVSGLPQVRHVIYMVGKKFGTQGEEGHTWAVNVMGAGNACSHFERSSVVVFSTGCVYPLLPSSSSGSLETDAVGPVGDYAQSCLGRERIFEYASLTAPFFKVCLFRLNYAVDLRYGVLHDIGRRVFMGTPVDLSASHFNVIWQGDACERALLCLEYCSAPPEIFNVTGLEVASTRETAEEFARIFNTRAYFMGQEEGSRMYLSNATKAAAHFGNPSVPLQILIRWQADWIKSGGRSLGKPTHFETTDGNF
jgi:dTDP-4-dehydrorhamnose reductase